MGRMDGILFEVFFHNRGHVFFLNLHDDQFCCPADKNSQKNNQKYEHYDDRYHMKFCSPLFFPSYRPYSVVT